MRVESSGSTGREDIDRVAKDISAGKPDHAIASLDKAMRSTSDIIMAEPAPRCMYSEGRAWISIRS